MINFALIFLALQFGVLIYFMWDLYRGGVTNFKQFYFRKWWLANQFRFIVIELCIIPITVLLWYTVDVVMPQLSELLMGIVSAAVGGAGTAAAKMIPKATESKTLNIVKPTLVDIARKEIGVQETFGDKHTERILQYSKDIGLDWVHTDETPWCAIFVNWVLFVAGYATTHSALAKSFVDYGAEATKEEIATGNVIAVWHRGRSKADPQGHVGFPIKDDEEWITMIGGNQSNSVNETRFRKDWRFIGYRKPLMT